MSNTTIQQVKHAIRVINEVYTLPTFAANLGAEATLIDWRAYDDGLAINVEETGIDAVDISANATVHGALPKGTFLEPINHCSLRLVRA